MTANYMLKATRIKSTCHSGLDPESSQYGSQNKFGMTEYGEDGRSMVEMLGVLAIIGVLSIGGVYGYTTAMRNHRANEIVNATSMLYMLGLAQNAGEGTGTLTYTGSIGASLSALKEITYANGSITVEITEDAVCNQVKTKLGDKVTGGDCTTAIDGAYSLTVSFGEVVSTQPSFVSTTNGWSTEAEAACANRGGVITVDDICASSDDCSVGDTLATQHGRFWVIKNGEYCTYGDPYVLGLQCGFVVPGDNGGGASAICKS